MAEIITYGALVRVGTVTTAASIGSLEKSAERAVLGLILITIPLLGIWFLLALEYFCCEQITILVGCRICKSQAI